MSVIDRTPWAALVNDDGSNTVGTLWTKAAIAGVLLDPIDALAADLDAADALKAPLATPALTGMPTAPTAAPGTNTTQLATTAFVQARVIAEADVTGLVADLALKAALASPALTGTPTAPTAAPATSTTQLATTAFVAAESALKAPLASPALTGTPAAPTAAPGTSTTQVATTAFVAALGALKSDLPAVAAVSTTGNITALALPAGSGLLTTYLTNASLVTIQGIVAGLPGQLHLLVSKGAGQVDLAHAHGSGTALGKLANFATVGLTSLAAGSGVAVYQYDGTATVWRLVAHQQGAGITPAYLAGNFTPSAGTWTVDAGDVTNYEYELKDRWVTLSVYLQTTTVSGAPTNLRVLIPAGLVAAKQSLHPATHDDAGAGNAGTFALINVGGTTVDIYKAYGASGFGAATNTTRVFYTVRFEVQ